MVYDPGKNIFLSNIDHIPNSFYNASQSKRLRGHIDRLYIQFLISNISKLRLDKFFEYQELCDNDNESWTLFYRWVKTKKAINKFK